MRSVPRLFDFLAMRQRAQTSSEAPFVIPAYGAGAGAPPNASAPTMKVLAESGFGDGACLSEHP